MRIPLLLVGLVLIPMRATADVITTTLDGCVSVTDSRLADAQWFAQGTFQAVAFDDDEAGCEMTIAHPVIDAYAFDEDRVENTLTAWLNLQNLPSCGRRQYDLHYYLDDGVLDPFGLKSLVIDTGVDCAADPVQGPPGPGEIASVPEPATLALIVISLELVRRRRAQRARLSDERVPRPRR